jgi:hypothetical protein
MDGNPSGETNWISSPSFAALRASAVNVLTTPLTWGRHASVAIKIRIRLNLSSWAPGRRFASLKRCDNFCHRRVTVWLAPRLKDEQPDGSPLAQWTKRPEMSETAFSSQSKEQQNDRIE